MCVVLICSSDGGLSHEPATSPSLSEFGGVSERSPLVVQAHAHPCSPSPPPMLHDLQQSDSTSYVLLNVAKGKERTASAYTVASCCVWWRILQTLRLTRKKRKVWASASLGQSGFYLFFFMYFVFPHTVKVIQWKIRMEQTQKQSKQNRKLLGMWGSPKKPLRGWNQDKTRCRLL